MTEPPGDGVHTHFDYVPDPDRISPNGAKKLLPPSTPAKFDYYRRHRQKPKREFDFGHLVHLFVLGEGEQVAPIDAPNYNTKAAQAARDKAYADGLVPVLPQQMDTAIEMARVVHEHELAGPLLKDGDAEVWLYATDPETGQKIRLRADWMTWRGGRIWVADYKTCVDANPKTFGRKAYDFGYHLQFAFSVVAARALEIDDAPAMVFICQEKEPPYLVSVNELDADAFSLGRADMIRAAAIFQQCTATGVWPGYSPEINSVSLPPWAFSVNQPTINDLLQGAQA